MKVVKYMLVGAGSVLMAACGSGSSSSGVVACDSVSAESAAVDGAYRGTGTFSFRSPAAPDDPPTTQTGQVSIMIGNERVTVSYDNDEENPLFMTEEGSSALCSNNSFSVSTEYTANQLDIPGSGNICTYRLIFNGRVGGDRASGNISGTLTCGGAISGSEPISGSFSASRATSN